MTDLTRREIMATAAAISALAAAKAPAAADPAAAGGPAWDLTDLYPTDAAWEAERAAIAARLPQIATYKGTLGQSAARLKAALQLQSDIALKVSRLYTYASLKRDEDIRAPAGQERAQKATDLATAFGEAISWSGPELLLVGKPKIESFLAADPGLAKFRLQLEDQLRQADHTLSPEGEAILAGTN